MASPILFVLFLTALANSMRVTESALSLDYYAKTCPKFEDILRQEVHDKQTRSPTTAAAVLRMFFHDCAVDGCDASVLLRPTGSQKTELDHDINHSLAGDAFDLVVRAKSHLELECPGIVSCSDILAVAARNLVVMTGGPHYKVRLGRKDSLDSQASHVEGHLARANSTMDAILKSFSEKGFNVQEAVALTGGGHTIGFAHCSEFSNRIFGKGDPELNPTLAAALRKLCANYTTSTGLSAFLDVKSPGVFDNTIFQSLQKGMGILSSDHALVKDPRTKPFVEKYAQDRNLFFQDFAKAMEKLSVYGIKTGHKGEVRKRCDLVNNS